jgi:hypothetical protein
VVVVKLGEPSPEADGAHPVALEVEHRPAAVTAV